MAWQAERVAACETTAYHTLIRGLATALPFFVLACLPLMSCAGGAVCGSTLALSGIVKDCQLYTATRSICQDGRIAQAALHSWPEATGTIRAMAQMNAAISRAMAVTTMFLCLPRACIWR